MSHTGSNCEVQSQSHGSVDCPIQRLRLSTPKTHVGNRAFVSRLSRSRVLRLCSSSLGQGRLCGPIYTIDDVRHTSATVGTEHLDGDDIGSFCDSIFTRSNSSGAVSSVTVTVLVDVVLRNGLSPRCPTFELDVFDVDTSVNDVDIDTFASIAFVLVLCEG